MKEYLEAQYIDRFDSIYFVDQAYFQVTYIEAQTVKQTKKGSKAEIVRMYSLQTIEGYLPRRQQYIQTIQIPYRSYTSIFIMFT